MWDHVDEQHSHLTRDRPCVECGHAPHSFLPCSDTCDCRPVLSGWPGLAA